MGSTSFVDASWAERSVFVVYMLIWIVYALLNEEVKFRGIQFNPATLVWVQETLKLVLSLILFFVQDGGPCQFCREIRKHWTMLCWYMIPAGLYALTDILTYINLRAFDPATYYLLSEMKLVVTAMTHQTIFRRRLHFWHWFALFIITLGCILKTVDSLERSPGPVMSTTADDDDDASPHSLVLAHEATSNPSPINYVILLIQIFASTVAGVYNEKLLKDKAAIPINLQNMCLYLDGLVLLSLGFLAGISSDQSLSEALAPSHLAVLLRQPVILAMASAMSMAGIVTSRFLKVFDSVRKSMASALVVVALPFLSWVLFGSRVTFKMVLSIASVVIGMLLYSQQPAPGTALLQEEQLLRKANSTLETVEDSTLDEEEEEVVTLLPSSAAKEPESDHFGAVEMDTITKSIDSSGQHHHHRGNHLRLMHKEG